MKRVIVACTNGVTMSQAIASEVNRLFKKRKVNVVVDTINIKSLDRDIRDCVAYITITKTVKEYPVPVINGIASLTGVRQGGELERPIDAINKS